MIKSLELSDSEWHNISQRLIEKHGPSIMISSVMRRKLGFLRRRKRYYGTGVYIDFWEEKYKTLFLLQWGLIDK